jgi:hypothetical protein
VALCQLAVESRRRHIMNWTLEVVTVPVRDVELAKHFYSEQVGCVVDTTRGSATRCTSSS